jgi:CHAT domain-containing protein
LAERAKARVLLDELQQGRANVQKAMTEEEQERERRLKTELTQLNTQLTNATQSDKPDSERISEIKLRLEKARLDYEAFQDSLYTAHPELKVHRGEARIINAEELAALLPDATSALLEYVVTDEATFLFVVTKPQGRAATETKVFTIPIKQTDLAKQVESFRRRLAERNLDFRAPAHKLYDLLLKPAQSLLGGKSNLVIVPDDQLWELPFQALIDERDRYLIERSAVSYAPSLTVLREMRARSDKRRAEAAPSTLLALGNPLIGQETVQLARLTMRDEKLYPLPEAEAEVRALGRLYGARRSKVYIGADAREDRLKAEAGQARILHFATHGVLNNAAPLYSYLALARGDKNEDGLLEAWELMQLDLKADLAALSACETARGRFGAGEGLIGLTWALFVAGVPSTVVSQWKVESASARDLMLNFHHQLRAPSAKVKAPMTKAEALRQAALKVMKKTETSHPFYWAGFVLVGDGG